MFGFSLLGDMFEARWPSDIWTKLLSWRNPRLEQNPLGNRRSCTRTAGTDDFAYSTNYYILFIQVYCGIAYILTFSVH